MGRVIGGSTCSRNSRRRPAFPPLKPHRSSGDSRSRASLLHACPRRNTSARRCSSPCPSTPQAAARSR
eukprot:scaffold30617_cov79-Isochrysis_galbana.AAC.2